MVGLVALLETMGYFQWSRVKYLYILSVLISPQNQSYPAVRVSILSDSPLSQLYFFTELNSGNLGTFSIIHHFSLVLDWAMLLFVLKSSGSVFQNTAPLQQKLFMHKESRTLGTIILPLRLSCDNRSNKYSGSLWILILKTFRIEWYIESWYTVSHPSSSNK